MNRLDIIIDDQRRLIETQKWLIGELQKIGSDTKDSEILLRKMEGTLKELESRRDKGCKVGA